MENQTREEVLDRVLNKLARLTDEQVKELVRIAAAQGIDLTDKSEPRE